MAGWRIVFFALQVSFITRAVCERSIDFTLNLLNPVESQNDGSSLFHDEISLKKSWANVPHSETRDISMLNHIEWRQNLSKECLQSDLWNPEFDQARQVYIWRLGNCITHLPQQDMSVDYDHLNTTICDTCISDFVTACDENGAQLCSVDVRFTDEYLNTPSNDSSSTSTAMTPSPTPTPVHQFKYRFYECIPEDCDGEDKDDFARGWFNDIANDLEVEEDDLEFATHCPRSDQNMSLGVHDDDPESKCNINLITSTCYHDLVTMRNDHVVRIPRTRYFRDIRSRCDCVDIPYEIGNTTEKESACLCADRARELEEACIAPTNDRKFCYYSFSYLVPDSSNPDGIHRYNFTYFDCNPGTCDNPFDRYSLDALRYKSLARQSAFGARFESYCFDEEKATSFLHTEACEDDEDRLRSGDDNSTSLSTSAEDAYNNATVQCFHDLLRKTPRTADVYGACLDGYDAYRDSCDRVNGTMCITSIKFTEVVDASFGEQNFQMTTYRCVAPQCDNDFDRSVYENYDRWMTDASLGIEENNVFVDWTCGPTPAPTHAPTAHPTREPTPLPTPHPTPTTPRVTPTTHGGDVETNPPAQPGRNGNDPSNDHEAAATGSPMTWVIWLAIGLVTLVLGTTGIFAYRYWRKLRRGRSTETRWAGVFSSLNGHQRLDQRLDSRIEHSRSSSRSSAFQMTEML